MTKSFLSRLGTQDVMLNSSFHVCLFQALWQGLWHKHLQVNHLLYPLNLNFCRYPDDVILELLIRMLKEKQKFWRCQLKINMWQAALCEQEKEKNPEQYRERNKKSCQEYCTKWKRGESLFYYFLLLYVVHFKRNFKNIFSKTFVLTEKWHT